MRISRIVAAALGACSSAAPTPTDAPLPVSAPDPDTRCAASVPGEKVVLAAEHGLALAGAGLRVLAVDLHP